jgi:hypothetical protein
MFTYTSIKKSGLVNNMTMIVHPVYDKIIPLECVNKFFFGVNYTPITTCNQYLLFNKIIIEYNDNKYLILSKLSKYFEAIGRLENYNNKYIIINYYNFIGKELNDIQKDIYNFNNNFINYLETKQPLFYNIMIKMIGKSHFNGKLVDYENITKLMSIMYDNIIISYGYENINTDSNLYVNLNNVNNVNNNSLYESIKTAYLMKDIDTFIIYNLTKITGNESFSKLLVLSHNKKENFCIPANILNDIIMFKNEKSKEKYLDKIINIYNIKTIWDYINGNVYFNFEGFNKYFLNLETNDLINQEVKEMICNLYYNITNELINSYKTIYYYK